MQITWNEECFPCIHATHVYIKWNIHSNAKHANEPVYNQRIHFAVSCNFQYCKFLITTITIPCIHVQVCIYMYIYIYMQVHIYLIMWVYPKLIIFSCTYSHTHIGTFGLVAFQSANAGYCHAVSCKADFFCLGYRIDSRLFAT